MNQNQPLNAAEKVIIVLIVACLLAALWFGYVWQVNQ